MKKYFQALIYVTKTNEYSYDLCYENKDNYQAFS